MTAAVGGVTVPAQVYLALNADAVRAHGWAVPTATDIAFAVGVLALLGRSTPSNIRVFLLALAIIDDVIAVLIIAFLLVFADAGLLGAAKLGVLLGSTVAALIGLGWGLIYIRRFSTGSDAQTPDREPASGPSSAAS